MAFNNVTFCVQVLLLYNFLDVLTNELFAAEIFSIRSRKKWGLTGISLSIKTERKFLMPVPLMKKMCIKIAIDAKIYQCQSSSRNRGTKWILNNRIHIDQIWGDLVHVSAKWNIVKNESNWRNIGFFQHWMRQTWFLGTTPFLGSWTDHWIHQWNKEFWDVLSPNSSMKYSFWPAKSKMCKSQKYTRPTWYCRY